MTEGPTFSIRVGGDERNHQIMQMEGSVQFMNFPCNCRLCHHHHHHQIIIIPTNLNFSCSVFFFFSSNSITVLFRDFITKRMIRNPNFQVRKRKWKTVLFMLRKRKRKIEEPYNDSNIVEENEGGGSRWHHDDDDPCSDADERDKNPMDDKDEVAEKENPSLDHVGEEEEKEENSKSMLLVVSERKRDGGDIPPDDDCCPICFENFSIACKTNCGHWFCANCILQFWTYRSVLQKCNCPICARPISKLTPEASLLIMHEVEVVEVLKNVQRYNRLFQGGVSGVIQKVFEVPNAFKRMLCGLMDPDRFRGNYYAMRSFALLMSCMYNVSSFDFIPTGSLGVRRLFDLCAIALVVILCLVGICHRLVLRRRVRRLAANHF